jgi:hypothetical protein
VIVFWGLWARAMSKERSLRWTVEIRLLVWEESRYERLVVGVAGICEDTGESCKAQRSC